MSVGVMQKQRIAPLGRVHAFWRKPRGLLRLLKRRGQIVVNKRQLKFQATRNEVDLADRSREAFENALEKGSMYSRRALVAWEKAEEKPAVVGMVILGLIFLYALNSTLGALEDVPLLGYFLKVVGIYASVWIGFRLVSFENDREDVVAILNKFVEKVTGKAN